jgi:hypothetical protein
MVVLRISGVDSYFVLVLLVFVIFHTSISHW